MIADIQFINTAPYHVLRSGNCLFFDFLLH